jgi:hypothetical protein
LLLLLAFPRDCTPLNTVIVSKYYKWLRYTHPKFGMDGVVLKNGRKINAKGAFFTAADAYAA